MIIDVPTKVKEEKPKPIWYLTDEQIAEINKRESLEDIALEIRLLNDIKEAELKNMFKKE